MIIITEGATMVAIGLVLLVMRPLPAIAAVVYFGATAWGSCALRRRRHTKPASNLQEAQRTQYQASLQGLGGIKEVKVRGTQQHFIDSFAESRQRTALPQRMSAF